MLHLLKKLKLYTKLGAETVYKALISIHTNHLFIHLLVIICRSPSPTKVFLQPEHKTELLLQLYNQYQGKLYLEMPLVASNVHILTTLPRPL